MEVVIMPIYTIVAGVNGVGKSSLTGVLKAERNDLGYVIDVDKIAFNGGLSPVDAGKTAIRKINEFLAKNISFGQETTLSGIRVEKTVKEAKEKGYTVRMFYICLNSCDESVKRISNRVKKGGHNIQDGDVRRRYSKRFTDLAKILPFCDEVHLFDNENGFVAVGEYKNGEIICKGDSRPEWLSELITYLSPHN